MSLLTDIENLHAQQTADIVLINNNYLALRNIESREFQIGVMRVTAVHNPTRAISSAAKVDKASIAARPCFLCRENRLEGQQSVICCNGRYEILVNPYPIFDRHFVIASTFHEPQALKGRIKDVWHLAEELKGYTVFYNGPRCGASAPDHMHFQAVESSRLPLWNTLNNTDLQCCVAYGKSSLSKTSGLPMQIIVMDAATPEDASAFMTMILPHLPIDDTEEWEPRFNLLASSDGDRVRIAVIPRPRHRPSIYTGNPDDKKGMIISPASVDVAGVFVLPRRIDFDRVDENLIKTIYRETCNI